MLYVVGAINEIWNIRPNSTIQWIAHIPQNVSNTVSLGLNFYGDFSDLASLFLRPLASFFDVASTFLGDCGITVFGPICLEGKCESARGI
jgi:hypothetical protein